VSAGGVATHGAMALEGTLRGSLHLQHYFPAIALATLSLHVFSFITFSWPNLQHPTVETVRARTTCWVRICSRNLISTSLLIWKCLLMRQATCAESACLSELLVCRARLIGSWFSRPNMAVGVAVHWVSISVSKHHSAAHLSVRCLLIRTSNMPDWGQI